MHNKEEMSQVEKRGLSSLLVRKFCFSRRALFKRLVELYLVDEMSLNALIQD